MNRPVVEREINPMSRIKVALVTGASRPIGLGVAIARSLAEQGYHVIVTARNRAQAEEQSAMLRDEGYSVEGNRLDLTDTGDFARIAEHVRTGYGHLDVLVNNASTMPDRDSRSALDVDIPDVRNALEVDVVGPWALVKAMRPLLEAAPAARVVNITSGAYQQIEVGADFPQQVRSPAHSFAKQRSTSSPRPSRRRSAARVSSLTPSTRDGSPHTRSSGSMTMTGPRRRVPHG